jgi:hypothetical protein
MKTTIEGNGPSRKLSIALARTFMVAGFLFYAIGAVAKLPPGPTNLPLDSWSFWDHTNWTSDAGYAPVSFTNLDFSCLGNGASLVVDTTNAAWLAYHVVCPNDQIMRLI